MMKRITDTPKYAQPKHIQTSKAKGSANEKKFGGAFCGFWYRMLIPEME